jgi:acyl-CoA synthetase (AMP-forming)/AMP-acid ligase II
LKVDAQSFREQLLSRFEQNRNRVLLRILLSPGADPVELTGAEILSRAPELARRYTAAVESSVVLLLLPHSVELFLLHFGLILEGRLPAILAWPTSRIDPEKYQRNLLHQLRHLPAHQLITLPRLAANLAGGLHFPVTGCPIENARQLEESFRIPLPLEVPEGEPARPRSGDTPSDAIFLQFSGGTTGAQKAVAVTASLLTAQLESLRRCLAFTAEDRVASWLPLYHDMGLIACLWFPLWSGAPSFHFSANDWLLDPALLFRCLERYRASFCWLPNFAFSYLAAQRGRMQQSYSLGHVRAWINCSEPVRLRSFREFAEVFGPWGVTMEALQASYAMAENIFAVTQTPLGLPPKTFPRGRLRHRAAQFQENAFDLLDDVYVSSGPVLEGMHVRVVNPQGEAAADAEPGNIQLRTECLFSGYWTSDGFITESIVDGWYSTGDYGFLAGEDLYVIGRLKDIIIVGGQNIFPEDVELVVNSIDSIYPGRVVAFGINDEQYGTERLAVVAELRGEFDAGKAEAVERRVHQLVLSTIGIAPRYAAVVPERWIVKSTAGKISRRDTRVRFLHERLNQPQVTAG